MTTKTDKYANLRATLEMNKNLKMSQAFYPDTIRALLADYDRAEQLETENARLKEALEAAAAVAEERSAVLPHYSDFIRGYANGRKDAASAIRALLPKEQGEKYDN